jgi:hypothetical protein
LSVRGEPRVDDAPGYARLLGVLFRRSRLLQEQAG